MEGFIIVCFAEECFIRECAWSASSWRRSGESAWSVSSCSHLQGDAFLWASSSSVPPGLYCLAGVALQSPVAVTPARRGADTTGCVGPSGNRCGCNARLRLPARAQSCSILILCFGTRHQ